MKSVGFRSGFAAIIGKPNVGKSTLLNSIVGDKLAIVADKPQTTRNRITGVLTSPGAQIVFIDTPGFHKPLHRLGEYMVNVARQTLSEVDVIIMVLDAIEGIRSSDRNVLRELSAVTVPKLAVINKIDLIAGEEAVVRMEAELAEWESSLSQGFERIVRVSASSGAGVEKLADSVVALLPEGPKYYPDDWISDQPERFVVAEFIREKILLLTRDEIPHSIAVDIEEMSKRENRELVDIRATIYVERPSQKGIIIGKAGAMLKQVGEMARADIERILGSQVNLSLWVKVRKDWRADDSSLRRFGYES